MSSILEKLLNKKITYINENRSNITYKGQLPIFIKEIKFENIKEKFSIIKKIEILRNEFEINMLEYIEENKKIYILFCEKEDIIDNLFESNEEIIEEIIQEAYVYGHSAPIKKKEINNLFEKELSLCKINFKKKDFNEIKNAIGTGFFSRINIKEIPFHLALFTNNHILDKNSLKKGNNIILDHKDMSISKILELTNERRTFTSEELDYTCVEIFDDDKLFQNDEIEKIFTIDQNILEDKIIFKENIDIFILQYPNGSELSLSTGVAGIKGDKIIYTASTIYGSSGSPIIKRDNYCIIGLHIGSIKKEKKNENLNIGSNMYSIINDIKKKISKDNNLKKEKLKIIDEPKKTDKRNDNKDEANSKIDTNEIGCKGESNNITYSSKNENKGPEELAKKSEEEKIKGQNKMNSNLKYFDRKQTEYEKMIHEKEIEEEKSLSKKLEILNEEPKKNTDSEEDILKKEKNKENIIFLEEKGKKVKDKLKETKYFMPKIESPFLKKLKEEEIIIKEKRLVEELKKINKQKEIRYYGENIHKYFLPKINQRLKKEREDRIKNLKVINNLHHSIKKNNAKISSSQNGWNNINADEKDKLNRNKKQIRGISAKTAYKHIKNIDKELDRYQKILKLNGGIPSNPQLGRKVSDLLLDSIEAKLSILNKMNKQI